MPLYKIIILAFVVATVVGCTCSVHPILNETNLSTDVDLTGTWERVTDDAAASKENSFSATAFSDGARYDITLGDKEFIAEIGKLGNDRWFQIKQADIESKATGFLSSIPVYHFSKFEVDGDTLRLYQFDDPNIFTRLKKFEVPFVLHEPSNGVEFYVLTADTPKLQKILIEKSSELLRKDTLVFRRRANKQESDEQTDRPKRD